MYTSIKNVLENREDSRNRTAIWEERNPGPATPNIYKIRTATSQILSIGNSEQTIKVIDNEVEKIVNPFPVPTRIVDRVLSISEEHVSVPVSGTTEEAKTEVFISVTCLKNTDKGIKISSINLYK